MARFFGPCVDGPWKGRKIEAETPVVTIEADEPASDQTTVKFAAGSYCFVHGSLDSPGEWRWRGPSIADQA